MRIQLGDGPPRFVVRAHFHEREPASPAGRHVAHHLDGFHCPRLAEELLELRFPRLEGQVSDK
jgi:hypothetical protein